MRALRRGRTIRHTKLFIHLIAGLVSIAAVNAQAQNLSDLIAAAKKEGVVNSVGMPPDWANWKGTWAQMQSKYGIAHQDTDMSSAQEVAKFDAEKTTASSDIGDVGHAFGPLAVMKGVTQADKPSTGNDISAWAKDKDGHWLLSYTGTMAFISNNKLVKNPPKNWHDFLTESHRVTVDEVGIAGIPHNRAAKVRSRIISFLVMLFDIGSLRRLAT